jgi:hypothetical protein
VAQVEHEDDGSMMAWYNGYVPPNDDDQAAFDAQIGSVVINILHTTGFENIVESASEAVGTTGSPARYPGSVSPPAHRSIKYSSVSQINRKVQISAEGEEFSEGVENL